MKKFILHIGLFMLPIFTGAFILLLLPTDKKRAYHYLTNDCEGRAAWLYHRIVESNQPVNVAFLGSSHTINGINDTLINQYLAQNAAPVQTVNLGYCRLGRDLTYVLMEYLIQQKNTKAFVIEVLPDENAMSHPVFPFLADGKDILTPKTFFNRSYLPNVYHAEVARLMYTRGNIFNEPYAYQYGLRNDFGFTTNTFNADTHLLNTKKQQRLNNQYKSHTWTRNINLSYPRKWLYSIHQLAKQHGLKIVFLYIPPYGSPEKTPIEMNTYLKYAPVWVAPDSIFTNPKNWYDDEHLNINGANSLSTWVAKELVKKQFY